ncbi:flagellar motor protein MotB [Lysinimonas soli]|uniref:Flagellar motor protein MotB n=1 Tax=Lysinimonas soli TaxID=1074233 RepID=A0ABW0NPX0_9MICO
MTRRHKLSHGGEHEAGGSERWTTSYMDMVTVLMCLFIVLYAMSTVDKDKFEKLRLALSTGFGVTKTEKIDTARGIVVPAADAGKKGVDTTNYNAAVSEVARLTSVQNSIAQSLQAQGLSSSVSFSITSDGLTISLVGAASFFTGNSAVLQPDTDRILNIIGPVLTTIPNQVAVEGHADSHSTPAPYASDWDLAAARSTAVLKYLVTITGVAQTQIYSSSYGSARPLSPDMPPSQYGLNRRVDIVIRSAATDDVKVLMAQVLAAEHR